MAGFICIPIPCFGCTRPLGLLLVLFWALVLVDCIRNEPDGTDKYILASRDPHHQRLRRGTLPSCETPPADRPPRPLTPLFVSPPPGR